MSEQTTFVSFTKSSRKRRILAFIIDHFVITSLMFSAVFLALGPDFMSETQAGSMPVKMFAVMIPGFLIYFAKDTIKGISIGRWVTGIMVRDENNPEQLPSPLRLLLRNILLVIWPIEFLVLATSDQKQRLGDKAAKTIVVRNPDKPGRLPRVLVLAGVVSVLLIFTFFFVGAAVKNSDAYKIAISQIEQNQEILTETGGITGYGMVTSANISTNNGYGEAQLKIKVLGRTKDLTVSAYLAKEPHGEWKLVQLQK